MTRIRVSVPATSAPPGSGLNSLALVLGLRMAVELSETEGGLNFEFSGEGADRIPQHASNLVVRGAAAVYRLTGYIPRGLHVRIENEIPVGYGLGSSAAAILGGAVAANVLLGKPLDDHTIMQLASQIEGRANSITGAMLGGLVVSSYYDGDLSYERIPVAPMNLVIAQPFGSHIRRLNADTDPINADYSQATLVMHALSRGDYNLLAYALDEHVMSQYYLHAVPQFERIAYNARCYGASAVTVSGNGPALIAFAPADHYEIEQSLIRSLRRITGYSPRTWILPLNTQGLTYSEIGIDIFESPSHETLTPTWRSYPSTYASPYGQYAHGQAYPNW